MREMARMKYYRFAQSQFEALMRKVGMEVADRINHQGESGALAVVDRLDYEMQAVLQTVYSRVGSDFMTEAFEEVKGIRNYTIKSTVDDYWEQSMVFYIEKNRYPLITSVANTYKGVLNRVLQEGVSQGLGASELAKLVTQAVPGLSRNRALVISRTEVINASNMGANYGAQATGLPLQKEWIATMDSRTRTDHVEADAMTVGMEEPFVLADGSRLLWPGDNSFGAPADQTIQCRCTQGYVRE